MHYAACYAESRDAQTPGHRTEVRRTVRTHLLAMSSFIEVRLARGVLITVTLFTTVNRTLTLESGYDAEQGDTRRDESRDRTQVSLHPSPLRRLSRTRSAAGPTTMIHVAERQPPSEAPNAGALATAAVSVTRGLECVHPHVAELLPGGDLALGVEANVRHLQVSG